ncbi:SnoaL-like domain-containing protein [Roseicella aerolata]|uniref:Nuclear transport factor 2 family protein n=1 Tax=Roseicella aerolata TaxID=2883479 RepID=A0A9X1ID35_9PROT|nr:SnoaL-like domain-containing protein [Roseicella aerolata]MCB4821493.1 nuclear transport factor 2 family protein [Roseicella aerolata]
MHTLEVAQEFVALCQAGKFEEAGERFWADDVVSIEPMEGEMAVLRGKPALRGKAEWWYANHEIHSVVTHGPYVNGAQFALRFEIDVTAKASGQRLRMEEIALYTLREGKIAEERFFGHPG